jgi:quinol-cytochrome oxidoreductase complex cytochrome b subunit
MKEDRSLKRWKKVEAKGLTSYLIKIGILLLGSVIFIASVFIVPFIDHGFSYHFIYRESFITSIIIFAILSPLMGTFLAYTEWKDYKKKYN